MPRKTVIEEFQDSDWASRKIVLVATSLKIQENNYNISAIVKALQLDLIRFKLTGDIAFIMQICGLVKGCGSCNPCPLCTMICTKVGMGRVRWLEDQAKYPPYTWLPI